MNWMRSFFKVFHTSRCVFSVLLFAQELRNEERHSRLFGRGGGGTWFPVNLEPCRWGILLGTIRRWCRLSFVSFFFFATSVDVRDFSVRITWRETQWPRVEWIIYFLKRYTSFFFSSFPFLNASYEGCSVCRHRCTYSRWKKSLYMGEEKKIDNATIENGERYKRNFLIECYFKRMKWTLNIILEYISNIFNSYKNIKAFQMKIRTLSNFIKRYNGFFYIYFIIIYKK